MSRIPSDRRADCPAFSDPRLAGDPVDTLTGAVFDGKLEFRLTGPLELWWWRHYDSSQCHRQFALGWGHTHDFDRSLHFDADGMHYCAPLARVTGFPPLQEDGAHHSSQGYLLRRHSASRYQLSRHGEPGMEFEFDHPARPAPLRRLFKGEHEILFRYDARHRLCRILDSAARSIDVVEGDDGRLVSLTLNRGVNQPGTLLLAYEYDEHGNAVRATHASGHGYSFEYDDAHRMVRRTGRKGFSFHFSYDQRGRCIEATGDDGLYGVTLDYTIPGRVTKVTRADGGVWTYFFDEAGALTQKHDPLGGVEQYVHDASGRMVARVDPAGNATRIAYDPAGAAIGEISPLGHRSLLPKDPNAPDPLRHRVAANAAEYEYGRFMDVGRIELPSESDARSLVVFPEARRLVRTKPAVGEELGPSARFDVRPLGVRWWPEPKRGWIFNEFGKLVEQRDEVGRVRRWSYDASGNIASYTDFDGGRWSYEYGAWHFLDRLTSPVGAAVQFSYSVTGLVTSCTDAAGTRNEYGYDLKDQLVEVRRHGRVRERYEVDASGNLVAKYGSDGSELLRLEIGKGNVPVRRTLASGDEHALEYDDAGRCLVAVTKKDAVVFEYDGLGNCVAEKRNGLGVEHEVRGCWRAPARSVFFGRFAIHYDRRRDGRLIITDPGGKRQHIRVWPHGVAERRFSNGSQEVAQYDDAGRCLQKALRRTDGRLWTRRYEWSGEGELRRVEDSADGVTQYEYDAAHRLQGRALPGDRVERYEMDRADNLLRQPGLDGVTLREGNRLSTANGASVTYNDRNHVAEWRSTDGAVQYTYDSRDQLTGVSTLTDEWHADYDAMRRRTRKMTGGRTTEYYWNGDQLVAEVAASGHLRLYVYADPLALVPLLFLDYESLDAPPGSCQRYFVFTDQIGTPRLVEDDAGRDVWNARIEPFGRAHVSPQAEIEFNLRFPGHYCDPELRLHDNRFRSYDPAMGRYLQSDPWGIGGGYNLYAYRANPLLHVDVRGLGDENDPDCVPVTDREVAAAPPPKTGGQYDDRGLPMTSLGRRVDSRRPVQIFTPEQREQYRVVAGPNGELVYPNQGNRPVHSPDGSAIYVMDRNGNMYVHENPRYGDIHHSSIAAGEEPVAAGHVAQIGEPPGPAPPSMMNNSSGHYQPPGDRTTLARDELASQGVDTSGTRIEDVSGGQTQPAPAAPPPQEAATDPTTGPTSPQTPRARGR